MTYARTAKGSRNAAALAPDCIRWQHCLSSPRGGSLRKFPLALIAAVFSILIIAGCHSSGAAVSVQVEPSGTISLDEGQSVNLTATVGNDTQNLGVNWSLVQSSSTACSGSGCGALSKVTNSSATYTAPTNLSAGETVTVTVASIAKPSVTTTLSVSVVLPVTFTTTTLPNGANGVAYNQAIVVTGGVAPLTFSLQAGSSLPPGLSLTTGGTIVGKPTSPGLGGQTTQYSFTVVVSDYANNGSTPFAVTQAYTISVTPPTPLTISTTSLPAATTNTRYAAPPISAAGGVLPLTWTLIGTLPPGLALSPTSGQISGVPTTTGLYALAVQAKDNTLPTNQTATSQNLTINVQAPQPLLITTSTLPTATTATPYSTPLQAIGGVPPYTWTITSGLLPSGLSLASNGVLSGTPILVTANDQFTVQVTDSEVTPQVVPQTLTISVNAGSGNGNALITGAYSFLFNGFDTNGTVMIAGSITTDGNGTITGGVEDSNRISPPNGIVTAIPLTGSYSLGTDGRGTMELVATNPSTSVTLTTDYRIVVDSNLVIHFFENNDITTVGVGTDTVGTHGEGVMKPVTGNIVAANFLGNYSFVFTGQDITAKPAALGGVLHADGTSTLIPAAGGVGGDLNDNGTFTTQNITGSFSVGANNRGGASLLFEIPGKSQTTLQFAFYFVSPSDMFFVELDSAATTQTPIYYRLSGEMIAQQSGAAFGGSSLTGTSVVTGSAVNSNNASVLAGLLTSTNVGAATFSYTENNGGTIASPSNNGTYVVGTNGRVAFTGLGSRAAVAYLTGPGQGLLLGMDAGVTTGLLEQQSTATAFNLSAVQGTYAVYGSLPAETSVPNIIGQASASSTSTGSISGTLDELLPPTTSATEGTALIDASLSGHINFIGTNGSGNMIASASVSGPVPFQFPSTLNLYVVSPLHFRAISTDSNPGNAHPQVFFFDH